MASIIRKQRVLVLVFFLVYLAIGISIHRDYGISWDEQSHRQMGMVTAKYLTSLFNLDFNPPEYDGLPPLAEYDAKNYGVVFDLPMYALEVIVGISGKMPNVFHMRHLCNFLLFYISVYFFYLIVKNRFDSSGIGLIGASFLILSPRIFAESFYSKDIIFLSLFMISIYFFTRYLNKKSLFNTAVFAMSSALATDQRIMGVFIPFLAVFLTCIDILKTDRSLNELRKGLFIIFIYLGLFIFFMVLFWPYLWENPFKNLIEAFLLMSRYPVTYYVLYLGDFIKSTDVPWHYIPLWIMISTPLIYIFFFLIGSFLTIRGTLNNGFSLYSNEKERQDFLFLLLFFIPLASVIILKSALYDGWRHMYFIYAPFMLIGIAGATRLLDIIKEAVSGREKKAAFFVSSVLVLSIGSTSLEMIRIHPFQNVYFNTLAGDNVEKQFDLDYWGLSFRKGLEYIVQNDKKSVLKLSVNVLPPAINNIAFLDKKDIKRLKLANIGQADYFLTNYRWHPQPYPFPDEVYSIEVDTIKIMSVFKLR